MRKGGYSGRFGEWGVGSLSGGCVLNVWGVVSTVCVVVYCELCQGGDVSGGILIYSWQDRHSKATSSLWVKVAWGSADRKVKWPVADVPVSSRYRVPIQSETFRLSFDDGGMARHAWSVAVALALCPCRVSTHIMCPARKWSKIDSKTKLFFFLRKYQDSAVKIPLQHLRHHLTAIYAILHCFNWHPPWHYIYMYIWPWRWRGRYY